MHALPHLHEGGPLPPEQRVIKTQPEVLSKPIIFSLFSLKFHIKPGGLAADKMDDRPSYLFAVEEVEFI